MSWHANCMLQLDRPAMIAGFVIVARAIAPSRRAVYVVLGSRQPSYQRSARSGRGTRSGGAQARTSEDATIVPGTILIWVGAASGTASVTRFVCSLGSRASR